MSIFAVLPAGKLKQPIGLFDSGLGGLAVARELARSVPGEDLIYLADSAHIPFGSRSREEVKHFTIEALHWLGAQDIKMAILACGTATAAALEEAGQRFAFPVIGVFNGAVEAARKKTLQGRISILATHGTVKSLVLEKLLVNEIPGVRVFSHPAPDLVEIVESGDWEGPRAVEAARRYLDQALEEGTDTIILGCTHFIHLKPVFEREASDRLAIVDPAAETAREAVRALSEGGLLGTETTPGSGSVSEPGRRSFYCTGDHSRFLDLASRLWPEVVGAQAQFQTVGKELGDVQD